MNKDALLATFIGFVVGLIVTGLVLYGPAIMKGIPSIKLPSFSFSLPKNKPNTSSSPTATPMQTKGHQVTIESPLPEALEQTEKMLVSGTTSSNSTVIVSGPVDDIVVVANTDGKYAGKVTLTEGKNDILVTSTNSVGVATQSVTVFYTPEEW